MTIDTMDLPSEVEPDLDKKTLPSSETSATPQPPVGEDIKDLVTPGDNAEIEAEAQTDQKAGKVGEAAPEDPEEAQSPT
jgi:hypothetical protein